MRKALVRKQGLDPDKLVTGAVIGVVDLVDCIQNSKSGWAEAGKWHLILRNPRRLKKPIPMKGRLGIFDLNRKIQLSS
jgi:hypothetical protein